MRIDDQASPPVLSRMLVSLALLGRLVAHAEAQTPAISAGAVAFSDVTVIDVGNGRRMEHQTVVLDGGRIVAMGNVARVEIPQQARRIDGRGKYLIPGLIDTHVHLATGPDRDSLSALPSLLAHGVTGVRDAGAGGQDEWLVALRSRAERGEIPSPRVYVSGMISGRAVARSGRGSAAALARHLVGLKVNGLKIRDGLTMDDIRAIVAVAKEAGVPVFGHTYDAVNRERDETYTLDAIRAGAVGTMHIMGSPQIGKNRLPDPPPGPRFGGNWQDWWVYHASYWLHTDPAAERALIETMVARHAWIEPTLITEDWITNADYYRRMWSERRVPGSFATTREGFPNLEGAPLEQYRQSFARMKDFVRRFHAAGGVVTTGTDCIPACGYGLEDELRLLVDAGLPPAAALRAATLDAARVLGWQDRVGRVATGMAADLVLLDDDPLRDIRNVGKIQAVVTNGRYLDRNALNALQPGAGPPFPPPARLVDVGGWRLHLDCTGEAKPNQPRVILEAGIGDFSVEWGLVQPGVGRFARVCLYDRAGEGWSELGPHPRTMRQIVNEPLRESDIPPDALAQMRPGLGDASGRANEPPRDRLPIRSCDRRSSSEASRPSFGADAIVSDRSCPSVRDRAMRAPSSSRS